MCGCILELSWRRFAIFMSFGVDLDRSQRLKHQCLITMHTASVPHTRGRARAKHAPLGVRHRTAALRAAHEVAGRRLALGGRERQRALLHDAVNRRERGVLVLKNKSPCVISDKASTSSWEFDRNKQRQNIMKPGVTEMSSDTFGLVRLVDATTCSSGCRSTATTNMMTAISF